MEEPTITLKQLDFLKSLLFGREMPEDMAVTPVVELLLKDLSSMSKAKADQVIADITARMSRREASDIITVMKTQPFKKIELGVPDGRYAIPIRKNAHGQIVYHFYQVKTTRDQRKVQYILRLFGAPGDFRRDTMTKQDQVNVAKTLSEDPMMYSVMFGKQVGSCGVCGSPLTDPQSIALGIGPICLQKSGW
jgi:hypothetical protein